MADKPIRLCILEEDFTVTPSAGLPLPLCVQQQYSCLILNESLYGQLGVPLMDFLLAYSSLPLPPSLKEMMDLGMDID